MWHSVDLIERVDGHSWRVLPSEVATLVDLHATHAGGS